MTETLADLQRERERIKAAQAKLDYDAALAATCSAADLHADARAIERVLRDMYAVAPHRLMEAIEGEVDETRIHYRMTEVWHHLLAEAGRRIEALPLKIADLGRSVRAGMKPRDMLTVSQWAEKKRELKTGTNKPGRWSNDTNPHLVEIMDALSEHSPVDTVTFLKPSGIGGSEVGYNWIGYIMDHLQNKDMLLVVPSLELRDREFNPRLKKMLAETPALNPYVTDATRDKRNRDDLLEYGAGARIIKAGANSPSSLRASHVPYVYKSEVDGFPWDVGGEGDPDMLIENRQRTFTRRKTYQESTPTAESVSRIEIEYKKGDQRQRQVPCPHCGEYQVLEWGGRDTPHGFKFRRGVRRDGDTGPEQVVAAWYVCRHHGCIIEEGHKTEMFARGRWVAQRPWVTRHRSYRLNGLYAPIGLGLTWVQIAQRWINAQGDTTKLKAFWNTDMGEVFKSEGDSIDDISLITRREAYPPRAQLPIRLVTAWSDVQRDRIETTIVGWGPGEECWPLAHRITPAETAQVDTWEPELHALHQEFGVHLAGIDARYNRDAVHAFCAAHSYTIPTQGMDGWRPIVEDEKRRRQRLRIKRKKGMPSEPIGTWNAKSLIYSRLKLAAPGPGYIHFPLPEEGDTADFDDEYFAQLGGERLVTKYKGTRPVQEWVQTRPRNEALDCLVGNLAIMRLSGRSLDVAPPPPRPAGPVIKRLGKITRWQ